MSNTPFLIRPDEAVSLEDQLVPEGLYDLRIVKADFGASKSGKSNVLGLLFAVQGEAGENAAPIGHWIVWPDEDDEELDPRFLRQRKRDVARLLVTFGWPSDDAFDPVDQVSDLVGLEGKCRVVQEEDDQGEPRNRVRLPKLHV